MIKIKITKWEKDVLPKVEHYEFQSTVAGNKQSLRFLNGVHKANQIRIFRCEFPNDPIPKRIGVKLERMLGCSRFSNIQTEIIIKHT